jgi:hypothetical protein
MRRAPAPVSLRHAGLRGLREENPLEDYLGSVNKLAPLPVETVLPGHGRPFRGLRHRLAQIQTEIQHQLDHIVDHLRAGPATAYALLALNVLRDSRPIAMRYSVSLVLARLRYLERLGRLNRIETEDVIRYGLHP